MKVVPHEKKVRDVQLSPIKKTRNNKIEYSWKQARYRGNLEYDPVDLSKHPWTSVMLNGPLVISRVDSSGYKKTTINLRININIDETEKEGFNCTVWSGSKEKKLGVKHQQGWNWFCEKQEKPHEGSE